MRALAQGAACQCGAGAPGTWSFCAAPQEPFSVCLPGQPPADCMLPQALRGAAGPKHTGSRARGSHATWPLVSWSVPSC